MAKLRPQDGFSLIELVVVVSIAAVVMAVLTPGIRQSSDIFTLRRAASLAVVELRTAQAIATNNGVDVIFEFYTNASGVPSGIRYWAGGGELRRVEPPEWPRIIEIRHSSGLVNCVLPADPGHKCLTFKPLGSVDNAGEVKLRVRDSGPEWQIEIAPATGRVRVVQ
ncbi:MAG TPA: prepilin-type N-terminal cleavage/methylation domain-containing protein [bacterium]|nr:prepilin-type N-terminal cleavage/methylation domain-containing protein [bacterium]